MIEAITIPDIGEKVESGKVVAILVSVGDVVEKDDGIIEFETEKAVVEIPSPAAGKIVEVLVEEGDELKIGDTVARLEIDNGSTAGTLPQKEKKATGADVSTAPETTVSQERDRTEAAPPPKAPEEKLTAISEQSRRRKTGVAAAPSVRRFARELGVDIESVKGTGPGGRISEKDVKDFVKTKVGHRTEFSAAPVEDLPDFSRWGDIERTEMPTVRRMTADSMAASWRIVPQVTQFDKADITHLNEWMGQLAQKVKKDGVRLTVTAVVMKVLAMGLKQFPYFNASMDRKREQIVLKRYAHIGMAVETDRGLLVPVVRHADQKSIMDLAGEIADLALRARNKRLNPDEMEGGSFTLSNQGGIGGTNFTPIVYWPQAAILGVSKSSIEPKYIGEAWQPRTMLPLSLSYDHRINDGAQAARFLKWICDSLEYPMMLQL